MAALRLRDQQSIEWVPVMEGQLGEALGVFRGDGEEIYLFRILLEVRQRRVEVGCHMSEDSPGQAGLWRCSRCGNGTQFGDRFAVLGDVETGALLDLLQDLREPCLGFE